MNDFTSIIFDLDGTLIDTAPDVRLALNHTLESYGLPPIKMDEIYNIIGHGAMPLLKRAFARHGVVLADEEAEKAVCTYLNYYQAYPVVETLIYPKVREVLQAFKDSDIKMGICTNKPSVMAHLVLEKLDLKHFFKAIVAGDEITHAKPHPHHIHAVLRKMNVEDLKTVMVGDSEIDRKSAEQAGIPFIGVSYGYDLDAGKGLTIGHFSELQAALVRLMQMETIL